MGARCASARCRGRARRRTSRSRVPCAPPGRLRSSPTQALRSTGARRRGRTSSPCGLGTGRRRRARTCRPRTRPEGPRRRRRRHPPSRAASRPGPRRSSRSRRRCRCRPRPGFRMPGRPSTTSQATRRGQPHRRTVRRARGPGRRGSGRRRGPPRRGFRRCPASRKASPSSPQRSSRPSSVRASRRALSRHPA